MADVPVIVQNGRLDIVAANHLGFALFSALSDQPQRPANFARFIFLDSQSHTVYDDWRDAAQQTVALLRSEAGRAPYDRTLTDLVGELSTRSRVFRKLRASHDVREHRTGIKRIHHPVIGDLELTYEGMDLAADRGLLLLAYTAAPRTPSHDALRLLASWAATSATAPTQPVDLELDGNS